MNRLTFCRGCHASSKEKKLKWCCIGHQEHSIMIGTQLKRLKKVSVQVELCPTCRHPKNIGPVRAKLRLHTGIYSKEEHHE